MKTTIDIPDALYKRAKIRAIERGQTLKQIVLRSLEAELESGEDTAKVSEPPKSYWANRRLLPEFKSYWESGTHSAGTDSTVIISEGRDER